MEKKKKIMIVDDEPDFQEMIKTRLEANNYEVITASTGEEALQKFTEEKPNAILLDVLMPGLNGMEVLEKIRKVNTHIPVFIITAFSSEERFKLANKLNATGFILKTYNLKDQIVNIKEAITLAEKYKG
ncbi:MAG: response regulator [Candidatus Omnitrophota bacterium]